MPWINNFQASFMLNFLCIDECNDFKIFLISLCWFSCFDFKRFDEFNKFYFPLFLKDGPNIHALFSMRFVKYVWNIKSSHHLKKYEFKGLFQFLEVLFPWILFFFFVLGLFMSLIVEVIKLDVCVICSGTFYFTLNHCRSIVDDVICWELLKTN